MKPGILIRNAGSEEGKSGTMNLEHADLTGTIIGAAIDVHRALGPGFIESIYERALVIALRKRGLKVEQQFESKIFFEGEEVGTHRIDLFVEDQIVVDLKTVKDFADVHFAVVRSQLPGRRPSARSVAQFCETNPRNQAGDMQLNHSCFPSFMVSS